MVLTRSPYQNVGGDWKILSTLSLALINQVDFVFVFPKGNANSEPRFPYIGKFLELDLKWHESTQNIVQKVGIFFYRINALKYIVQEEDPDLILSNSMTIWHHQITRLKLCGLITKKVILRFGSPVFFLTDKRGKLYNLILTLGMRYIIDQVIVATQGIAKELESDFKVSLKKIKVINNPIPLAEIIELSHEDIPKSFYPNNTLPVILNVAQLHPDKNHELLIRAFRRIQKHIDAYLVIVGVGTHERQLRDLVYNLHLENNVYFMGWQQNPFKYMRRADIFVLSSNHEGFGNVIVEAMACGCPVIATNCPYGPSEILDGGKYGILVPMDDEERLAREIVRVLSDQELRQTLARKGKQRAREFNAEVLADQYARIFYELAGQ